VSSAQMKEETLNHQRTGLVIHDSLSTRCKTIQVLARLDSWPCRPVTYPTISILIFDRARGLPYKGPTRPQ
jgi:hypothetical protein